VSFSGWSLPCGCFYLFLKMKKNYRHRTTTLLLYIHINKATTEMIEIARELVTEKEFIEVHR
jgi:hypothetical protein